MVSGNETSPRKKIKVVDRRWFDESGELRDPAVKRGLDDRKEEVAAAEPDSAAVAPDVERSGAGAPGEMPGPGGAAPAEGEPARVRRPSGAEFSMVVDLLAQQAAVLLTGAQGIEKNPAQARLFIDLLDILQEKTRGRLAPEEARYLRDVLAQLQLAYVESGP